MIPILRAAAWMLLRSKEAVDYSRYDFLLSWPILYDLTMNRIKSGLVLAFFTVLSNSIFACEPCTPPSYSRAWDKADLVVTAARVDPSPALDHDMLIPEARNFTEINIKQVLKGTLGQKRVKVKTFYGMCDYGLLLPDNHDRLIFLRGSKSSPPVIETLVCKPGEPRVVNGMASFSWGDVPVTALERFFSARKEEPVACVKDQDCRTVYDGCGCAAFQRADTTGIRAWTSVPVTRVCKQNICRATGIQALCRRAVCVRADRQSESD